MKKKKQRETVKKTKEKRKKDSKNIGEKITQ